MHIRLDSFVGQEINLNVLVMNRLRPIHTYQTAQDMLRIVEAHGRTKIQYWGFSYGDDMGVAFASMFQDKIDRFVKYAIVDSRERAQGNTFTKTNETMQSFHNMSKTMQSLFNRSANACHDKCRFLASSHDEIRRNLTNLMSESIEIRGPVVAAADNNNIQSQHVLNKNYLQDPFVANTSHPMLLVGDTASNMVWVAKSRSSQFPNSVVLTQNSTGHAASPSLCTFKYVRQYFIDGKLPEPGTVCEVDAEEGLEEGAHMNEDDKVIFNALKELGKLGLPFN